jgi:hypothetical protein
MSKEHLLVIRSTLCILLYRYLQSFNNLVICFSNTLGTDWYVVAFFWYIYPNFIKKGSEAYAITMLSVSTQ